MTAFRPLSSCDAKFYPILLSTVSLASYSLPTLALLATYERSRAQLDATIIPVEVMIINHTEIVEEEETKRESR